MKKRGNQDIVTFVVFGVIAFLMLMGAVIVVQEIQPVVQDFGLSDTQEEKLTDRLDSIPGWVDGLIVAIIVTLLLAIIISGFFIAVHPVFLLLGILAWIGSLVAGLYLGDEVISLVSGGGTLTTAAESLPMAVWFMSHWLAIMIATGVITLAVTYGVSRNA